MFPFGHNPYAPSFQTYDPYEELLLQQELQRRRQAEEYHRRRQLEELNRRRAEQLEYARRQAELQRRREAEARRRHQQELETRRRKLSEPAHPRPSRLRIQEPSERDAGKLQSTFDGGVQDLFDMLYGDQARPSAPAAKVKRSKSSDPRARQQRINPIWSDSKEGPGADQPSVTEDSAVSDTEEPAPNDPAPRTAGTQPNPVEAESARSQSAISGILKSFSDLKSAFVFPNKLDFLTAPGDATVAAPKLAYTPNNAPLHQYEHLLTGLLTKLDAVESYGQESIRKARKDVVRQIEQELEELDVKKLQEWRRQSEEVTGTSASMVVDSQLPSEPAEQVSTNQGGLDPASIPLPHDEDSEMNSDTGSLPSVASSESLATPPAQPSDLPPSDNAELHRASTPVPMSITSDPPMESVIEKSAAETTEVGMGVGSADLDKANGETISNQVDLDDIWEVEF